LEGVHKGVDTARPMPMVIAHLEPGPAVIGHDLPLYRSIAERSLPTWTIHPTRLSRHRCRQSNRLLTTCSSYPSCALHVLMLRRE
jgi:hypothetical protein